MTTLVETDKSFYLSAPARILDTERDMASEWAGAHIMTNPALKWITGKYVEADNANSNGQYWTLEDLRLKQPTITHAPMNIAHDPNYIVGTYVASELIYAAEEGQNPFIETLGAYWKYYFPDELADVEAAHKNGRLFQSMECISDSVTCVGPDSCGETFPYAGPMADAYCDHIKERASYRQLNNPHFLAGALILPPYRPGWKGASVNELSQLDKLVSDERKDRMLQSIAVEAPELSASEWEILMFTILDNAVNGSF